MQSKVDATVARLSNTAAAAAGDAYVLTYLVRVLLSPMSDNAAVGVYLQRFDTDTTGGGEIQLVSDDLSTESAIEAAEAIDFTSVKSSELYNETSSGV